MKAAKPFTFNQARERLAALLGIQQRVSHREILVSAITAALAMAAVYVISHAVLGESDAPLMIASMGSSAILVFAVPHGAFSQPWAVLGGHGVSALAGVLSAMFIPSTELACAVAVGASIAASLLLRCLHPSGGGTALVPVLGGETVQSLGFSFVAIPVLINAGILILLGVLLNAMFHWRRYPAALGRSGREQAIPPAMRRIEHDDLKHALEGMETSVEITESDLSLLLNRAVEHALRDKVGPEDIHPGGRYSNTWFGPDDEIRAVLSVEANTGQTRVRYQRIPDGEPQEESLADFARWARRKMG